MNCKETQQKIIPYINGQLSERELESFLHHIRSCKECYDELEIYYIIFTGLQKLEGDDERFDFQNRLQETLHESERMISRKRAFQAYYLVSQILASCAIAATAFMTFVLRS